MSDPAAVPGKAVRPFLKWAGGKYALVEAIRRRLPAGNRLVEPFVGAGAAFLNIEFAGYRLSDTNPDLIALYRELQEGGADFVRYARRFFDPKYNCEGAYYELRDAFNDCRTRRRRAALFLYLNRHGYNGLCRYNSSGGFNVPFGSYKRPYFPHREMLYFHERAQRAEFIRQGFEDALAAAEPGDVVYADPPYVPLSGTANFTAYSRGGFSLAQQQALAAAARACAARGVPVLISNHANDATLALYEGADVEYVDVRRSISCDGGNRGMAPELLALFA